MRIGLFQSGPGSTENLHGHKVLAGFFIAGYVILMTIMGTLPYFTRRQLVAALGSDTDMRATVFARIEALRATATGPRRGAGRYGVALRWVVRAGAGVGQAGMAAIGSR